MPELPEVETMRLQLKKYLTGHKITSVEVNNRKTFQGDEKKILDTKILDTRRFGKVSVIDLANGYSIITHVKLTGQFIYRGPNLVKPRELSSKVTGGIPGPHTLVIFNLDRGGVLYYNDVRRFGWIKIEKTGEVESEPFIKKLGPEPFKGLTLDLFREILSKTSRSIKVVLMDQEKMGGVGNIYANDALWLSKINPKTPAKNLKNEEAKILFDAILKVLEEGLKYGGASELAFVTPDGTEGNYQNHTLVYGHEGEPCDRCHKTVIKKVFLGGRGTYFCPFCQKE
ncbi:DNA-formamidopyrimidine glycosylase [Candidatus Woesebacteria bacterium RIFOXYC1_FULL_41_14]|uniref:DNA-formamidopyrimidine glycosylase n=3 Tax=Candidatus Woeseibacteriota TaxID=1752722 RepID=A0A1F8DKA6_9BACT|nr:MAG: DNA-formamidopyrimidine glycosylase [Candidatus Woesebacteria bacterium RIFOXYB1_FULL_41_13]OGM84469.1 MAG: DNA-formamidopyrimidine glycosylase [Candidatus Woesebacteria bacterium RIFOXYC1_FULL_41_14]OGM88225.1 MAG: DNA-formamidopyrimidine glycosylase [Candidatus Woesebacteria bacterium RIFOXYD1_FULL_41_28]